MKSNDDIEVIQAMNLNSLDLNLVRVFDALMKERSVTRAGERIGLSQPAVSSALNRLRHALGDQLFVRRGNEMVATLRAEELAEPARAARAEIARMIEAGRGFDPARLERTFTLLGADFFSMLLMPRLAREVAGLTPGVKLRLLDSARGDVATLLREDAVDMAMEGPLDLPDWVSSLPLFLSPFVIIAARNNLAIAALEEGAPLPPDTFCALPHALRSITGGLSGLVDEALARTGRRRRVTLALPHFQGVALAVAQGPHLAAVPLQFADAVKHSLGLQAVRAAVRNSGPRDQALLARPPRRRGCASMDAPPGPCDGDRARLRLRRARLMIRRRVLSPAHATWSVLQGSGRGG